MRQQRSKSAAMIGTEERTAKKCPQVVNFQTTETSLLSLIRRGVKTHDQLPFLRRRVKTHNLVYEKKKQILK